MSTATKELGAGEEALIDLPIPPRLLAIFENADREIHQAYGLTPGATALARLWLTCATASQVRKEFESAVLEINGAVLAIDEPSERDGDDV